MFSFGCRELEDWHKSVHHHGETPNITMLATSRWKSRYEIEQLSLLDLLLSLQMLDPVFMTFRSWYLMWRHLWRHFLQTSVHIKCAPSTQELSQMALSSHCSVTFWNHMTLAAAMCMSIYRLALMRLLSYVKLRYMVQQVRSFKFMRLSIYSNVFWNAITFWIKKSPCTY